MIDVNPLRYFAEVAKVKNFTKAARNCHVAQPALSQQIKRLETRLGMKLLERLPRGAQLTNEGELLLPVVQRALVHMQEVESFAAELRGAERGLVRIVALPSATVYVLPPKIAAFKRDFPRIDIVLEESITEGIPQLVSSGAFDLGVTQALHPVRGMTRVLIHEEDLLLVVSEGHRLAGRSEIKLSEAAGEPFIVTKKNTEFRNLVTDLCRRAGFDVHVDFEADHFDSLQAYAAVGMGVALIPKSTVLDTLTPKPRYIPIKQPQAKRRLWLLWPETGIKNKIALSMVPYLRSGKV